MLPAVVLASSASISPFCILHIFQIDQRTCMNQRHISDSSKSLSSLVAAQIKAVTETTYIGLRTSIFIFCLGVRSPCLITAMTQRSSILKSVRIINIISYILQISSINQHPVNSLGVMMKTSQLSVILDKLYREIKKEHNLTLNATGKRQKTMSTICWLNTEYSHVNTIERLNTS